jgi:excinuclease ABC subunit C
MENAAARQDYELAAFYRDQIVQLRKIQAQQYIYGEGTDVDVIALATMASLVTVTVLSIRNGRMLGGRNFFLSAALEGGEDSTLSAFIIQYYLGQRPQDSLPNKMVLSVKLADKEWIAAALQENLQHKIEIQGRGSPQNREWLKMAEDNAKHALEQHLQQKKNVLARIEELKASLNLSGPLRRIECFDVSHTFGDYVVASCVVYGLEGPLKADYRRFNIEGITGGDDYAAMRQALTRRYQSVLSNQGVMPDLVLIDGGKSQLNVAIEVMHELGLQDLPLLAIAKGAARKAGLEQLFVPGNPYPLSMSPESAAFHLLQQIRDEAHRFAITSHRKRRAKGKTSTLESIEGVGSQRRRQLLRHFGGLQQLKDASVNEIAQVAGISQKLASKIYEALRHSCNLY